MKSSLEFAAQVMAMPLEPNHKNFPKILSTKQAIAASMLTATARVRDQLLRPSSDDGFAKVRAAIERGRDHDGEDLFD